MFRSVISFYVGSIPFHPGKLKIVSTILRALPSVAIRSRYGVLLYSDGNDKTNMFSLLGEYDDVYEVVSELQPGMAFIDIGANGGVFSMVAAKRVGADGIVVAFEPNPTVFSKLISNASINALTNFFPFMAAIGPSMSLEPFAVDSRHTGMGHLDSRGESRVLQLGGALLPDLLRTLIEHRNVMIKIDVEGAELDVLKAMGDFLESKSIETVIVEINGDQQKRFGTSPKQLYGFMQEKNFNAHLGAGFGTHYNEIFSRS
jgi:FkbM family methyltransferase